VLPRGAARPNSDPRATITIPITGVSRNEPSTITISNLTVLSGQLAFLGDRDLHISGNALVDNTHTGAANIPTPRWANGNSYVVDNFVTIGTPPPGTPGTGTGNVVVVDIAPGANFNVAGQATPFGGGLTSVNWGVSHTMNTVATATNTLYVPFRAVIEAMTGQNDVITFFAGNMYENIPHVIRVAFGTNTAYFTVGASTFRLNGVEMPMVSTGGEPVAPFIGDGTNGTVVNTTYLPLRFIAEALGFGIEQVGQTIVLTPGQ